MDKNAKMFDDAREDFVAEQSDELTESSGRDVVRDYRKIDGSGDKVSLLEYAMELDVIKDTPQKEFKKIANFFNKKYGRGNLGIVSQPQGKKELWLMVSKWMKNVNDQKVPTEVDMLLYRLKNLGFNVKEYEDINKDEYTD